MSSTLKVYNPFKQNLIDELPLTDEAGIEKVLSTAYAVAGNPDKLLPAHKRIKILENVIALMTERKEQLSILAAREGGKPIVDSEIEIDRAINGVKLAISSLYNLKGEEIPMGLTPPSENRMAFTFREPIGVVLSVSAFNHPLNLIIHQVIPAVAVGCPVIIKPASATPLSASNFVKLLYEAGLPETHCQFVVCKSNLTEKMVSDPRVAYVSFIGSAKIGWYLRSKLAPGTRIALEHGGSAPVIIDSTVDIKSIAPALLKGSFYHAGQVCVSVQRIFAHESLAKELATYLADKATKLKVGDALDRATEVGPLISPLEVDRVDEWVKEASLEKGVLMCGGKKLSETTYAPTILFNPPSDAKVSQYEVFGPVVCIYSYSNSDEAIRRANALPLAFQASVFSQNLDFAMKMVKRLNASAVMVNDHTAFRVDWMPFGGRQASGLGWGGIPYSMHEMTHEKLMVIKSSEL